jgi:hypothetical protein
MLSATTSTRDKHALFSSRAVATFSHFIVKYEEKG